MTRVEATAALAVAVAAAGEEEEVVATAAAAGVVAWGVASSARVTGDQHTRSTSNKR